MQNAAAARRVPATDAPALRSAACFLRASGARPDPSIPWGAPRSEALSTGARPSESGVHGKYSSSWRDLHQFPPMLEYGDRCIPAVMAITKNRFFIGNRGCPIRRQVRPRNSDGRGIRLHGDWRCALAHLKRCCPFAHLKGFGRRLNQKCHPVRSLAEASPRDLPPVDTRRRRHHSRLCDGSRCRTYYARNLAL